METPHRPWDPLLTRLRAMDLEVVDKRSNGGCLWVIGGRELEARMRELQDAGFRFTFVPNGGKATDARPGRFFARRGGD